ncbi:MAG: SpoIVB peptidase S55 domain-containing protein [Gemmatales bacterium]|nr:hypothetical protein [Gemmatales bacterium]MDW7994592.1 SpoIVB peptidase S55 domain-containing protein [Gemmatales bacterium]
MRRTWRRRDWVIPSAIVMVALSAVSATLFGARRTGDYWAVEDIKAGMKGYGLSVFRGNRCEKFEVEILGVLRHVSPGRDLILARLSGAELEQTGVIAGMSGSPVYVDNKLVGAISYAWTFAKEPIAGITPFAQMVEFVESFERREGMAKLKRVPLTEPVRVGERVWTEVWLNPWSASSPAQDSPTPANGLYLEPLRLPLAGIGFTRHSLDLLEQRLAPHGMLVVQGGAAGSIKPTDAASEVTPGSALVVALVVGDLSLYSLGTVTHVEGDRIYAFGHPFLGLGRCEFPLFTGYVHTVCPRQNLSFKLGSPLEAVGVLHADVSTGISGWLKRQADMLPVEVTVRFGKEGPSRTYRCRVARHRNLTHQLVFSVLTNAVDAEGELPDELTAELVVQLELEGQRPIVFRDLFSGSSVGGNRAPPSLYQPVANLVQLLHTNPVAHLRLNRLTCDTTLSPGRISAEIDGAYLENEVYAPGETLVMYVWLKPYRQPRQRVRIELPLPADLPEGNYTAQVMDDLTNARYELRDSPQLSNPTTVEQLMQALAVQTGAKRTRIAVRVVLPSSGVVVEGKALPDLPPSMAAVLSQSRHTIVGTLGSALVVREDVPWVVQGQQSVAFRVARHKPFLIEKPAGRTAP